MAITDGLRDIRNDIRGQFKTDFEALEASVTISYANAPANVDADDEWVRITFPGSFAQGLGGIGERVSNVTGLVTVQCFAPLNTGTKRVNEMVDAVIQVLQGKTIGSATLGAASHQMIGVDADGRFWQENVSVPFRFEPLPS